MDLTVLLTEDDLRRRFGTPTYERAAAYVRAGHVVSCTSTVDSDGDLTIRGRVVGSRSISYSSFVSVGLDGDGVWFASRCDCPMQLDCKHVVALVMSVRAEQQAAYAEAGHGDDTRWERQLSSVLDELDEAAERTTARATRTPLAIQVELDRRVVSPRSWQAPATISPRGTLRIRPVKRGARDNWVKSGVSFQELARMRHDPGFDPDQLAVLNELAAVHQAASRYGYYHGSEPHLTLATFGASLWPALSRAAAAGLPLVAGPGLEAVAVADEPVAIRLDVTSDDGSDAGGSDDYGDQGRSGRSSSAGDQGRSRVSLGIRAGDRWYDARAIDLLGDPGHGAALWAEGSQSGRRALTLARLDRPAGPQVRRMLASGEDLVVPATSRADLVRDYLPRLQRHVPVVSSDGSVDVPEPAVPRLAVTVTWVVVDEVRLHWTWRYEIGGTDRVYGLTESRGLRGVRRPELERDVVSRLELSDEQVFALCDSHRLDRGLLEHRTFTHSAAIGFAEDVLPTLETLAARDLLELEEVGGRPDYRAATSAPVIRFAERQDADEDAASTAKDKPDWLDLEVVISVDGQYLALAALL